jgi:hypothetical protein
MQYNRFFAGSQLFEAEKLWNAPSKCPLVLQSRIDKLFPQAYTLSLKPDVLQIRKISCLADIPGHHDYLVVNYRPPICTVLLPD